MPGRSQILGLWDHAALAGVAGCAMAVASEHVSSDPRATLKIQGRPAVNWSGLHSAQGSGPWGPTGFSSGTHAPPEGGEPLPLGNGRALGLAGGM